MKQASAQIYSGVDRAERRRIARELTKRRELLEQAKLDAKRILREDGPTLEDLLFRRHRTGAAQNLARSIVALAARVPVEILACHQCRRPTNLCTCTNEAGDPLIWSGG